MSIPEGWKLVPVEPTEDMMYELTGSDNWNVASRLWQAALAAAPAPPAQEDEPVYQINIGPDKWWDVDKGAFDQITINAPPKRVLYTHPQSDELRRVAEDTTLNNANTEKEPAYYVDERGQKWVCRKRLNAWGYEVADDTPAGWGPW
jgi:hypothetical protein